MICENCGKEKPDTMARSSPLGDDIRNGKKYCTACCVEIWLKVREWMRAGIPEEQS